MNLYIIKLRQLLEKFKLDAIIIYANSHEDSAMKAIAGTFSILQDHILITKNEVFISTPSYLVADLKQRTNLSILSAPGENETIFPISKILGLNRKIGIAGFFKHADLEIIKPSVVIDLNKQIKIITKFKSDQYICSLQKHSQTLSKIVTSLKFRSGETQVDKANKIRKKLVNKNYDLAFPVCITNGKDLLETTSLSAGNKKINSPDVICVDMGIKKDIFTTDMTRMFFVNNDKAKSVYALIQNIHNEVIQHIVSPKIRFADILDTYDKIVNQSGHEIKMSREDFGHGIGFSLHEEPMLEKSNDIIGTNIVFTIEPTFETEFGLMRIEDMIGILSNGKVLKLT